MLDLSQVFLHIFSHPLFLLPFLGLYLCSLLFEPVFVELFLDVFLDLSFPFVISLELGVNLLGHSLDLWVELVLIS